MHTRKLAACARFALIALAAAGAGTAVAAGNDPSNVRVQLVAQPASAGPQPPFLIVSGTAPARCAPSVGQVTLDGTNLNIALQPAAMPCTKASGTFRLRIDPSAETGMGPLPAQVYRVRVYSMDSGVAKLLAFSLLDTGNAATAATPENGFWWSEASSEDGPAAAGNGISLELQGDQLAVGLFGFADSGAPTWTFGTAALRGHIARAALVQLANGDTSFALAGQPTAQAGPRLELEFLSPSRARAYVVRSEAGRDVDVRSLTLARSHFATGASGTAWSGQWVLIADDGGTPRQFDFADASNQDAETFHLADVAHDATLDCRLAAGTQQPELCTLSSATATLADFDQVGIDHLAGHSTDGARVKLLRIPR